MVRTGKDYVEGLRVPREVYVAGELVRDVTEYPPFKRPIESYARLYDMKHEEKYLDVLTYVDSTDKNRYDISFLVPKSQEELKAKGHAFETYARSTYGCMGRGPDFMAALLAGMSESFEWFEQWGEGGAKKVSNWVQFVKENDLFLTHALGNPQSDRSKPPHQQQDPYLHLRIKEETSEGLVIRGAKQLATAAPMADEILVFPNGRGMGPGDEAYCLCFAVPTTTQGVKILCREPLLRGDHRTIWDRPLSSRFEEIDALIVFDDVLVPWDRVFFYGSVEAAQNMRFMTGVAAFSGHQSIRRAAVRAALTVSVAQRLCASVKTDVFPNVGELLGRLVAYYKAIDALVAKSEDYPRVTDAGTYWVNGDALTASGLLYPDFYTGMLEVIKRTGAAGLMLTPTVDEFVGDLAGVADTYFAGADLPGSDRVQISKLAWELAGDSFGQRLTHYERFYIGEPMFVASFYARSADMSFGTEMLDELIAEGQQFLAARREQATT